MLEDELYLGVNLTSGRRPFVYIALDRRLSLVNKGTGSLSDILSLVLNQASCIIAICSPYQPNQGIVREGNLQSTPTPGRKARKWADCRLCEFILRNHRIRVTPTPASERDCPHRIREGFRLYRQLVHLGFQRFPTDQATHQFLEVHPHSAFTALLGYSPLPKHTLEGRLQRQLALHEKEVQLPDPMGFFEEITRYRVLQGNFPLHLVLLPSELDATIAAYCAWLARYEPSSVSLIGDPVEGQILIPTGKMKPHY
ncbi:MAG: DUF429 domain-containing protein [Anaerolineales bacterium]|nr:DUF429 domain-containing protein [Anaerolineales bacterium]MDW8446823.1 DUF429 domain-containing protein [Anaerolineales bacterium]